MWSHFISIGIATSPFLVVSFSIATFLIHRLPTPVLHMSSPYQELFSTLLDYAILKTFSCTCFPNLYAYNTHKFAFHTKKCVLIGIVMFTRDTNVLIDSSGRVYITPMSFLMKLGSFFPLILSFSIVISMCLLIFLFFLLLVLSPPTSHTTLGSLSPSFSLINLSVG